MKDLDILWLNSLVLKFFLYRCLNSIHSEEPHGLASHHVTQNCVCWIVLSKYLYTTLQTSCQPPVSSSRKYQFKEDRYYPGGYAKVTKGKPQLRHTLLDCTPAFPAGPGRAWLLSLIKLTKLIKSSPYSSLSKFLKKLSILNSFMNLEKSIIYPS